LEKGTPKLLRLYDVLIQPALPHIRVKELILVPHDVLHYLPFHALQGSEGKYLIEQYPDLVSIERQLTAVCEGESASGGKSALTGRFF